MPAEAPDLLTLLAELSTSGPEAVARRLGRAHRLQPAQSPASPADYTHVQRAVAEAMPVLERRAAAGRALARQAGLELVAGEDGSTFGYFQLVNQGSRPHTYALRGGAEGPLSLAVEPETLELEVAEAARVRVRAALAAGARSGEGAVEVRDEGGLRLVVWVRVGA